jgi:hypothetical protein
LVLGMSLATFTLVHVVLSLIGIAAGLVAQFGMLAGKRLERWTALFLITTILTSVTGFFFPVTGFLPSHAVGIISLVFLAAALVARYGYSLAGGWRVTYVVGATVALYLNAFVAVVQGFQKMAFLKALAPTQSEPPFLIAQLAVLAIFVALGVLAARAFHPSQHVLSRA